ncbi:MAG TPA: tyrosine-type recombinase/integrase, partial [Candidatus Limnocylindrales bacterium]
MKGHTRKRGEPGTWEYIVDIGLAGAQRCEGCGKRFWVERRPKETCPKCGGGLRETEERRRETKAGFATRKECQAAMNKLLVAVDQQAYTAPTKASVREYLTKEWLPAVKATIRPSTYNSYVQHVECHIAPHIGSLKLAKLTGSQVNALYAKLAESGKQDGRSGLSPLTIHHVHACLHKACKDAVRWGHISRNPLDAADPPRKKSDGTKEMQTWSREQLKAFLASIADERLSPLWHLIAMTGMRRGEAIGLRWIDVDLENARLAVRRALIPINREVVVSEPKTAKGRRVIALDPGTVEVLKGQAARQLDEQASAEDWLETGLVFTAASGAALDPESVSRYWRQAVKMSLLPQIRLHDLRHTHATLALQAGIHPKVVSERLGHATISITLDTYSHAVPAMQEEAAALIAALVFTEEELP